MGKCGQVWEVWSRVSVKVGASRVTAKVNRGRERIGTGLWWFNGLRTDLVPLCPCGMYQVHCDEVKKMLLGTGFAAFNCALPCCTKGRPPPHA